MKKIKNAENDAKKSESAYSNSCSKSQSKRSYSPKSMHSGSDASGSSGYGGKQFASAYRYKDDTIKKPENTENKAKVSDSAYSNSYSNGQSRSYSSKFMHSGSNWSGSSGYGGKLSTSDFNQLPEKRNKDKEGNKNKQTPINSQVVTDNNEIECTTAPEPAPETPQGYNINSVVLTLPPVLEVEEEKPVIIGLSTHRGGTTDEFASSSPVVTAQHAPHSFAEHTGCSFTCVVSMQDGIIMYVTASVTAALDFPKEMWLGRSFIDFLHPRDCNTFASRIASGVAVPTNTNASNELILNPKPFVIRHSASGVLQYIDPESVPYLGYLPQDVVDKNALQLYHPSDLGYIRQVYETIVREGVIHRSKPYRMLAQNGHYLKLETEWSSFINPWSRKLEFVTGKHFILQGPMNPDVFQSFDDKNIETIPEEEQIKAPILKKKIIEVMNEVLTKPAKVAKQQMSRKCHDLALFVESLADEIPNNDSNLTVEMDVGHSLHEPGSVMLGGMSLHHDSSDSKTSSETPVSYNRLNYNDTLRRYFDNHEHYEEYPSIAVNIRQDSDDTSRYTNRECVSPEEKRVEKFMDKFYYDANLLAVTNYNHVLSGYQNSWLTESVLKRHNLEMEKELVKNHRETRCTNKGEKEKLSNELRQKKKNHLARCNVVVPQGIENIEPQQHGVKRASIQIEEASAQKHRCSSERLLQQMQIETAVESPSTSAVTDTMGQVSQFRSMDNSDYKEHGLQYQMDATSSQPSSSNQLTHVPYQSQMTYMMFGRAVYRSPFMYSAVDPYIPNTQQKSFMPQITPSTQSLAIPSKNHEQVKLTPSHSVPSNSTDEESSYSSFYSSFFKTDSGSNEDNDTKNVLKLWQQQSRGTDGMTLQNAGLVNARKTVTPKRNTQPPWLNHVNVTFELIYKYQIVAKDMEEVLKADREKLQTLEQPALVNEQLGQLYMDLERKGLPAKLNIEEGITSSSSSGEEFLVIDTAKLRRRKRDCSQLVMIYEEDAPLPPPDDSLLL